MHAARVTVVVPCVCMSVRSFLPPRASRPRNSFGIRRLGFKCSWWHRRQANDAVASEPSIFSENHDYKVFPCHGEHVRTYISGSRCARVVAENYKQTHTYTHTEQLQ